MYAYVTILYINYTMPPTHMLTFSHPIKEANNVAIFLIFAFFLSWHFCLIEFFYSRLFCLDELPFVYFTVALQHSCIPIILNFFFCTSVLHCGIFSSMLCALISLSPICLGSRVLKHLSRISCHCPLPRCTKSEKKIRFHPIFHR